MFVVVYGTLKKTGWNHRVLGDADFICECTVRNHLLFDSGFPVAAPMNGSSIRGEIYAIGDTDTETKSQIILRNLDSLEGYKESRPESSMYHRVSVKAHGDNGGTYPVSMYVGNPAYWDNFKGLKKCPEVDNVYTWESK